MYKLLLLLLLPVSFSGLAQFNEKIKPGPLTLVDSVTRWSYVLDSSHQKVTAFNDHGDSAWAVSVVFPLWGDSAKTKGFCRESIWSIEITHDIIWVRKKKKQGGKIIVIEYESNCAAVCEGYIELKSGKYYMKGCD